MTLALTLLLKSTLLFALCGLILFGLRRASASARHLVCLLTLSALLALPLFSMALPGWRLPVLSQSKPEAEPTPVRSSPALPAREGKELNQASSPVFSDTAAPPATHSSSSLTGRTPAKQGGGFLTQGGGFLLTVYALGVLLAAVRPLLGLWGIAHLRRACVPAADLPTLALADDCAATLGLKRRPLLCRADVPLPMTWGWLRPMVLLPSASTEWPEDRLRAVLLHEMAHVVRRDWPGHRLADLACALYWFHPCVWLVARRLRAESEIACDDLVVSSGIPAAEYARHLLEIAQSLPGASRPPRSAIAMAQTSKIEKRLTMILDKTQSRRTVARRALVLVLVPSAAALVTLAVLRPTAKAQIVSSMPVASASVAAPQNVEISRTYFDIDMVPTLAGIANPGNYGNRWWSAAGALLPKPVYPMVLTTAGSQMGDNPHEFKFAFRLPPAAQGITVRYKVPQSTGFSYGELPDSTGGAWVVGATFPALLKKTNLQVGVAAGSWRTVSYEAVSAGTSGITSQGNIGGNGVLMSPFAETAKGSLLTISTTAKEDIRVVAIDKQGQSLLPADIGASSINGLEQKTAHFSQPLSQIKEFRVETRPFVWTTFKDVALMPSGAVAIAPIPGITPAGTAATIARLHQIYGFIQTFRKRNSGAFPNRNKNDLELDMTTHPAGYQLPEQNAPNYTQAMSYFTSPDSRFMQGVTPDMVNGFIVYSLYDKRPDGTSVGTAKPAGTRDVFAYTNLYVRDFADGPVGFYLVLWDDGTVSRVPAARARLVPAYNVDKASAVPDSEKKRWIQPAFPGQAGLARA